MKKAKDALVIGSKEHEADVMRRNMQRLDRKNEADRVTFWKTIFKVQGLNALKDTAVINNDFADQFLPAPNDTKMAIFGAPSSAFADPLNKCMFKKGRE